MNPYWIFLFLLQLFPSFLAFINLLIYCLFRCKITILSLSCLPIQVSFICSSLLLPWRILSFLHNLFSPVLIWTSPFDYIYIISCICFCIYPKVQTVLSFSWALYSHSKRIFCFLCSFLVLSDQPVCQGRHYYSFWWRNISRGFSAAIEGLAKNNCLQHSCRNWKICVRLFHYVILYPTLL